MFGIMKLLTQKFTPPKSSKPINIITSIEDPFSKNLLHKIFLYEISPFMEFTSYELELIENFPEPYVPLIKIPTLFYSIIKNCFPEYPVYIFPVKDYYTNIIIEIPDDPIIFDYLDCICKEIGLCYCIYKNLADPGFKFLNKKKNEINFNSVTINKTNYGMDVPCKNYNYDICYFKRYKYLTFHVKNIISNSLNDKIEEFKNKYRFRWMHLLLPLYCGNSPSINELTKHLWNSFNNTIKLKFGFDDYIDMKLHPFNLLGTTTLILFRRQYFGTEFCLTHMNKIFANSIRNWIKVGNTNYQAIIFKTLNYNYNYIGSCPYECLLRKSLIYYNSHQLEKNNFPLNCGALAKIIDKEIPMEKQIDTNWKNIKNFMPESFTKNKFINSYISICSC